MEKKPEKLIPVHSLDSAGFPLFVQDIEYKNSYDYTSEHRHNYYEVFFFNLGGGDQLIDFNKYPVKTNSCYIVFPQQVHLLRRAPQATGVLVQFSPEMIRSGLIQNRLNQMSFNQNSGIVFEEDPKKMEQVSACIDLLRTELNRDSWAAKEISVNYLQALLLKLMELCICNDDQKSSETQDLLFKFFEALELEFATNHSVSRYADKLNVSEKKLSSVTKKHLGMTPLQVIHSRLLLEIKRKLLFEDLPHKELAYQLGFDSPANFSLFVKNKTGLSPSLLFSSLKNFHK